MYTCSRCNKEIQNTTQDQLGTGYGLDMDDNKICYTCCAMLDREHMGTHNKIVLYLSKEKFNWEVTNWPGTLKFKVHSLKSGRHNIARTRIDVWFTDHNNREWWGVQYGENTMLVHCKKLKVGK